MVTRFDQVIGKGLSIDDYKRAREEFELNKRMKQAEIRKAEAPEPLNIQKLGEKAFFKAAQGLPITPQERAAATYLDAKSGGMQFDPVTGAAIQKPSLIDKIPLDATYKAPQPMVTKEPQPVMLQGATEEEPQPVIPPKELDYFEQGFQEALAAAKGNPKLEQQIQAEYAKAKLIPGVDESKAAGFADRMLQSGQILANPKKTAAAMDVTQRAMAEIPLLGNYIVSGDYQSFNQAQRDFINAQLRRESGAVISPEEFTSAEKQYFPTPGDSPETLAQKEENRRIAIEAMVRSAGPSYKRLEPKRSNIPPEAAMELKKNPSSASQFDEIFGEGASKWVLGK